MVGVGLNHEEVMKQTYSYRTKDWRYILYMDGTEELYHDKIDPFEWENLANQNKFDGKMKELNKEMLEIIEKY